MIQNTTLEDIYEAYDTRAGEVGQNTGIGLIFDITGTTNLIVVDLYANNVLFMCKKKIFFVVFKLE